MLLIVMHESGTWRVRPGQVLTFGRGAGRAITLPAADRGVSRSAGTLAFEQGTWWLRNDSSSAVSYVSGDRGFRVDLPPSMQAPMQQWHAKIRLQGLLGAYTLRLRLPDLDDMPDHDPEAAQGGRIAAAPTGEHLVTSTRHRPRLSGPDRLILAARFEEYLNWRHAGPAAPRSAKQTAERIGWQAHTVAKRCENIRDRYSRLGVAGLRGPRALDELAMLLISTGELTAGDLRRLPAKPVRGSPRREPDARWGRAGTVVGVRGGGCAGEEPAGPAHALGGGLGVVAEFLGHQAGAATEAELPHGGPDRGGHGVGGRGVGWLQPGGEQCPAPGVVNVAAGHGGSPHRGRGAIWLALLAWPGLVSGARPGRRVPVAVSDGWRFRI